MNLSTPFGRVLLHVRAMLRHGKVKWHLAGIRREFASAKGGGR